MIPSKEYVKAQKQAADFLKKANIIITKKEEKNIEIVDHGFGDLKHIAVQILVYINTDRYCAKELIMFPRQIVPQHRHPAVEKEPGKQETFRCRYGTVYLYVPGEPVKKPKAKLPPNKKNYFTVWNEIILKPGDQYTLEPDTWHWFQAGDEGAVISEFSSKSRDEFDIFEDPDIIRITN